MEAYTSVLKSYLAEMVGNMMNQDNLTDVTIVSEDNKTIRAHKLILSAISPVFNNIFCLHDSSSTVFLRGIGHHDLEALLQHSHGHS